VGCRCLYCERAGPLGLNAPPLFRLDSKSRALAIAFTVMGLAITFHALHAVFGLGHPQLDGLAENWVYILIEFAAVGVCAARVLRRRENRAAWLLVGVSLLTWTAGDSLWTFWLDNVANPPYPSIADALYLTMYPAMYVALLLLMRSHFRHVGAAVWLDGIVVGLTTAAIGAGLVFPAVEGASKGTVSQIAVNLAYPLGDFLLLVFVALGFTLSGWRPGRQWLLLGIGIALSACADMIFVYQEAHGTYVAGRILDTMWPASMAVIALAAWQPASSKAPRIALDRHTVVLPAAFGALALALLVSATTHPLTRVSVVMATGALLAAGMRGALTYRENVQLLKLHRSESVTDALTGLRNRRQLLGDLDIAVKAGPNGQASTFAFFDLNGFKRYNDSFGHVAGDALLKRLGMALAAVVDGQGKAYRLGGDEFCVLLDGRFPRGDALVAKAEAALADQGSGFTVTTACGSVIVPEEASTVTTALSMADGRMYAEKGRGRPAGSQAQSVLLQLVTEREPTLLDHVCDVGLLAVAIGRQFDLDPEQLDELGRAAELHDIGKLAIPDEILHKPGPLSDSEQRFMRQHTIIGERILNVAPALRMVARLVRSSHERWDGSGYPDHLAGAAIPLGARIISACDAYDAIVSDRPYQDARQPDEAIAELRRHAGSQFDPDVVEALCQQLEVQRSLHVDASRRDVESRPVPGATAVMSSPASSPARARPGLGTDDGDS
jgi:two-component system cell cycle response regulator